MPALTRLGHRVVATSQDCFDRVHATRVVVDATLQTPPALTLVEHAVREGAKVAAVAPPNVVPLLAAWKSMAVTVLSTEDLRKVVSWVHQAP